MKLEDRKCKVYPNAKINLLLNVFERQGDYHKIESVILPIPIYDELTIQYSDNFILDSPFQTRDICLKVLQKLNIFNIKLKLVKKIPVSVGLGGESSDAAFLLKTLNSIFSLNLGRNILKIAHTIGSDVPFFLYNVPAFVTRYGESIYPISCDLNNLCFVIAYFRHNLENKTKIVYEVADNMELETFPVKDLINSLRVGDIEGIVESIGNSLEKPATKIFPKISYLKRYLIKKEKCLGCVMTGSGPAVVGIKEGSGIKLIEF